MSGRYFFFFGIIFLFLSSLIFFSCKGLSLKEVEAFHRQEKYAAAADGYYALYQKTSRKRPERRAYFAFKAGENYRAVGNNGRAYNSYMRALNLKYPDSILYLRIGQLLQKMGKYLDAQKYYNSFLLNYPNDYFAQIGLKSCLLADSLLQHPTKHKVTFAQKYNSGSADFSAVYSPDGDIVYFTSSRNRDPEMPNSQITGLKPNDLFVVKRNAQGEWSKPDSVAGGINTAHDEGIGAITPDGTTMYYSYAEQIPEVNRTVHIYKAQKSGDGGWSKGTPVDIWTDTLRMSAHPAVNASGTMLYFVSDQGGYGRKDLYRIPIGDSRKGNPENLGPIVNTPGDELFPTMIGDSTLIFSSNGHPGLGGLDLYKATLDSLGNWHLEHLGIPINSTGDDFSLALSSKPQSGLAEEGFLSSNRKDGKGRPHLYHVRMEAVFIDIDGLVMDREGEPIANAVVRVVDENGTLKTPQVTSREDGSYKLTIEGNNNYLLHASHPRYLSQYTRLNSPAVEQNTTHMVDFYLAAKFHPEILNDIYYDFDAASLRPQSQKALDALVKILEENPTERIEISAHADRKGTDKYNQRLTEQRAMAVVEYLKSRGIDSSRLNYKGYSYHRPYVVTESMSRRFPFLPQGQVLTSEWVSGLEQQQQMVCDQLNRRTEFIVIMSEN